MRNGFKIYKNFLSDVSFLARKENISIWDKIFTLKFEVIEMRLNSEPEIQPLHRAFTMSRVKVNIPVVFIFTADAKRK